MKITILQEKLKKGLSVIERISSKSLTLPILNNTLVSTDKNFLNLSATDLEIGVNWWGLAKIEKEGKITVPSKLFYSFINLLPNKKIDIFIKNNDLNIACESHKTKIKGFTAEEFPLIPKINKDESISIKAIDFCKGLSQIVDIASISTTKPEISGVYFNFQKKLITAVATDSFRLGEKKMLLKEEGVIKKDYSLIIPQKTIKEVVNIFGEKEGDIRIYFSPNQIMFESLMPETDHPEVQIISRLIEGEYPNYQEIIPKESTNQIIVNREDFINQIKTASLFASKNNEIKIKTNEAKNEIIISSQSSDLGDHQSSIGGEIKGSDLEVFFNCRFLLDGLLNIKSPDIILELSGDSGPGVIKSATDESYIYIIMPIKSN